MKPSLADVNVLLALLVAQHEFHPVAAEWYEDCAAGEVGICRVAWLGVVRLLGNAAVMKRSALSAREALDVLEELMADERCEFIAEPAGVPGAMRKFLRYPVPTQRLVSDAYFAGFAAMTGRRLVTLDGGFKVYRGLDVEVLS